MQRRAAAIYFVFFLVIGAGAYGFMTVTEAQRPDVSLDAPAYEENESFSVGDREYTVAEISAEGGEEGITRSGTLEWENETANGTVDLEEGENVTLADDEDYLVHFPNNQSVQLTTNYQDYLSDLDRQNYFQERRNGIWGVTLVSLGAAAVLLATAYLPVKD